MREDGVYHLSTSMYPKHRKRMLKQIKERLREGKKCIVISTSLVEAGVDLDFYTVYRQLSGIDSIIQAAGRCNREGKRTIEESKSGEFFSLMMLKKFQGRDSRWMFRKRCLRMNVKLKICRL